MEGPSPFTTFPRASEETESQHLFKQLFQNGEKAGERRRERKKEEKANTGGSNCLVSGNYRRHKIPAPQP